MVDTLDFASFKQFLIDKIRETSNQSELSNITKQGNQVLSIAKFSSDEKSGFVFSYADYTTAVEDCRKLKNLDNVERVEMMIGVRELPYPFICVVETNKDKMEKLDDELMKKRHDFSLRDDEAGINTIEGLLGESQSLLRRKTWETDPPLMGFMSWEE
jgi:hypothetical protein